MPATTNFVVKANIGTAVNACITIYSDNGLFVCKNEMQIDGATAEYHGYLPSGNYLIMVETGNFAYTGKLIVK